MENSCNCLQTTNKTDAPMNGHQSEKISSSALQMARIKISSSKHFHYMICRRIILGRPSNSAITSTQLKRTNFFASKWLTAMLKSSVTESIRLQQPAFSATFYYLEEGTSVTETKNEITKLMMTLADFAIKSESVSFTNAFEILLYGRTPPRDTFLCDKPVF